MKKRIVAFLLTLAMLVGLVPQVMLSALAEELTELSDAVNSGVGAEEELGDLLFSAVNVARHLGLDPEVALGKSCDKFISRFEYVELESGKEGKILSEMTLSQMDELY